MNDQMAINFFQVFQPFKVFQLGIIVDFQVSRQFRIGYAYEHPISDIRPYSDGTHEILLMYEVFKNKRIKSPRYF